MIKVNCETKDKIKLTDCVPFQGDLKKRTSQDITALIESLRTEGLMMPFAIWRHDDKNYLLDGHGRREALTKLALDMPELLTVDWPCVYVEADTENDARKALLQITSSYGKVTRQGYKQFCVSIPEYHAPVINKFIAKPAKQADTVKTAMPLPDTVVMRIKVKRDRLDQIKEIFRQFDFIEVI